jgi:hypothetical protein
MSLFKHKPDNAQSISSKEIHSYQAEFQAWLQKVHDIWVSTLPETAKWLDTKTLINGLSEGTYVTYFPQIVGIIQKSREKCEAFKDSAGQVAFIINKFPRLEREKELLLLYIKERRKKYGLEE